MEIVVRLDVMLARRKMKSKDLAAAVGITVQNMSLLKSGKVKGVRFETLAKICEVLECRMAGYRRFKFKAGRSSGRCRLAA